jgi:hypothetical protein
MLKLTEIEEQKCTNQFVMHVIITRDQEWWLKVY